MVNYYICLDVDYDATDDQIKKSYRKLAVRYHPDKNPGDDSAAALFRKVREAYEVLSDAGKKRKYDIKINVNSLKKKKQPDVELETTSDIVDKQTNTGRPNVVIDPNGEVYVDISKMKDSMGINADFLNNFFGR